MILIETERLLLRSWQESDAEDLYRICLDPELRHSGLASYNNVEEALKAVRYRMKRNDSLAIVSLANVSHAIVSLAIVLKTENKLIGFINLGDMNRYEGYQELEYAIACDYRNKGYATEALRRMLAYAFDELAVSVVAAYVHSHNVKSAHVLEKCGFLHEGTLRKFARDKSDTLCYSIIKEDVI